MKSNGAKNSFPLMSVFFVACLMVACGGESRDGDADSSFIDGGLLLTAQHGGDGAAWGLPACNGCHSLEVIHQQADQIRGTVRSKGYASCTGCHGRNGSDESEPRQCTLCHNPVDLPVSPWLDGQHGHLFSAQEPGPLTDEQCVACHVASDMNGVFELNRDLTGYANEINALQSYTTISDFCLRCHNRDHQQQGFEITDVEFDNPLIAVEDAFKFVDQHGLIDGTGERIYAGLRQGYGYASVVQCTDCHAMHGTNNEKLIIDHPLKGVTLLDRAIRESVSQVVVRNGGYEQFCVLCHQMEQLLDDGGVDTGNGLSGVHEVGTDCRFCHTHGESVQAGL